MDYLKEERAPLHFSPDWLIEPPPPSPFLEKKEVFTHIPWSVKLVEAYRKASLGDKYEAFEQRTTKEIAGIRSGERKKLVQARIDEKLAQLASGGEGRKQIN